MREIAGKTALITGGSAGVGLAAARRVVERGANVAITGRDQRRLQQAAATIGAPERVLALVEDLAGSGISASLVSPGPIDTGFIMSGIDEVPDLVFSQPMSSAEEIAGLILQCISDGRAERAHPPLSGVMAHLGYLFPSLARALRPALERHGRRAKTMYRARSRED